MFKYALIWLGCAIALALIMGALDVIAPSVAEATTNISIPISLAIISIPSTIFVNNCKAPPAWKESFAFAFYCVAFYYVALILMIAFIMASEALGVLESFSFLVDRNIDSALQLSIVLLIAFAFACVFQAIAFYFYGRLFYKVSKHNKTDDKLKK
ncbi:MAG: hypothetical protein LBO72_04725 [Helicobacteraceae bacterium]|jgi:hypothetical protein|nr:hypothetical protein [Helicobacteraceae bacterium]